MIMKMKNLLYFLIFGLTLSLSFSACSDNDDEEPIVNPDPEPGTDGDEKNQYVNNWIYDELADLYLWNDKMPSKRGLDLNLDPYEFFYLKDGVLYNYGTITGDRFSKIEGTHANLPKSISLEDAQISSDIGFEYINIQFVDVNGQPTGDWAYLVLYVKKNSNAEKQGLLKRGHLITKVDDTKINSSNRFDLLYQNKGSYKLAITDYEIKKQIEVTVNRTVNYEENPIYLDSIYSIGSEKIGYIVYNSFEAGGETNLPYDVELSKIFTKFQNNGVNNVILDLRYNGGGLVRSAQFITSALVPNRSVDNIFEIKTYNPSIQKELDKLPDTNTTKKSWMYDYFVDKIKNSNGKELSNIPNLGDQLKNIYIIATGFTASASEMTINTLRPYMKTGSRVVHVGEQTIGKNVGSWAIYEDDKEDNTYVMWPIIFKSHNKNRESNYAEGFEPDIKGDDLGSLLYEGNPLKNLGDKEETLLSLAIADITGEKSYFIPYSQTNSRKKFLVRGSSLEKKRNANQLTVEREKSTILKEQLKTLEQ